MKIRIRGDSIRYRLKVSEVRRIAAGESIVEKTHFPGSILTSCLEVSGNDATEAQFGDGRLVVRLPRSDVEKWAGSDDVSLVSEQNLGEAGTLSLLIEKDFKCLEPGHHRDCDDDEDTYPHPSAQH
ncbi:MAG: hypothetical protein KAJ57_07840 [Woeseiaceae bacterium]|nr:hypothetical protein [Woeseiaceae bacterium]